MQTRQIYVYAQAGLLNWQGPWRRIVTDGVQRLGVAHIRGDGLARFSVGIDDKPFDDTAMIYEQAFTMLSLASAAAALGDSGGALEAPSRRIRDQLRDSATPNGAIVEGGAQPYQANAHMHLLEACLAWEAISADSGWGRFADTIVELALSTFIDPERGVLREFFDGDWKPKDGDDGQLVEPGHQFEWAWLLFRYSANRGDARAQQMAFRLYEAGSVGVVNTPRITIDAINADGSIRDRRARLWPQTEWLKAAALMSRETSGEDRNRYLVDAAAALWALQSYFTAEGLWRDKKLPNGSFVDEPAPASSLYHIIGAFTEIAKTDVGEGLNDLA